MRIVINVKRHVDGKISIEPRVDVGSKDHPAEVNAGRALFAMLVKAFDGMKAIEDEHNAFPKPTIWRRIRAWFK